MGANLRRAFESSGGEIDMCFVMLCSVVMRLRVCHPTSEVHCRISSDGEETVRKKSSKNHELLNCLYSPVTNGLTFISSHSSQTFDSCVSCDEVRSVLVL